MARYPYRILKNAFDRVFRNDLNKNFEDIEVDIRSQSARVDNLINEVEQPSEVVDARVDADGHAYPVLKERLDTEQEDVRQFKEDFDTLIARIGNNEELNTTQKATLILAINEVYSKTNDNSDNITSHINEMAGDDVHGLLSGGHIIEESGENENGHYVRFADGTQICTQHIRVEKDDIDVGGYYETAWIFPATFVSYQPRVFPSPKAQTSYPQIASNYTATCRVGSMSQANVILVDLNRHSNKANVDLNLLAVGRWK